MPLMDTRTGALGPLPGAPIPTFEDFRDRVAQAKQEHDDEVDRLVAETPQVSVPSSFVDMTPEQRLGVLFGSDRGKSRKASRQQKKNARQLRYDRAARRAR